MSLINDALKRAEADKPRQAHSSAPVPALQPVESRPASGTSPILLGGILLLGVGSIAIAAALWFNGRSREPATATNSQTHQPAVAASSVREPEPLPPPVDKPKTENVQPTPARSSPVSEPQIAAAVPTEKPLPVPDKSVASTAGTAPVSAPKASIPSSNAASIPKATPVAPASSSGSSAPSTIAGTDKPIRLQSIFYRLRGPTVILNGKTLSVGDSVDGIKVVSIQRTSVEIVQNGKYRTLTLQD